MAKLNASSAGQSLFIVDRDWLRQGSKARKSWTGNVRSRSLYGLAIEVTQYDTPEKSNRGSLKSEAKRRKRDQREETSGIEGYSGGEQIIRQQPEVQEPNALQLNCLGSHDASTRVLSSSLPTNSACTTWLADQLPLPHFSTSFPGFEQIKGLECYLDYYLDVVGTSQHPIETKFNLQSNPIRSSWFPLAFEDDLWLQNIAIFSARHHASNRNQPAPENVNKLMSSFLSQLNDRISRSDFSDGTIASISCLALGEHLKGNDQLSKVHASGLAEMVRLRGGLHTIQRTRRTKIVRADIIRSVDTMGPPMLPRLMKEDVVQEPSMVNVPRHLADIITNVARCGMAPELVTVLWTLSSTCQNLEVAWSGQSILDATSYYENVLCINHDLLSFTPQSTMDEIMRISILDFTQPMFRYCAFAKRNCRDRSAKLRVCLEQIHLSQYDKDLVLWILFQGYTTSHESTESTWFKTQLCTALDERQIPRCGAWIAVRNSLQRFLWTNSVHDSVGKILYDKLTREDGLLEDYKMTCKVV